MPFESTEAKVELFNILNEGEEFGKIKIEVKNTDKMTENQKISFVKEYFSKAWLKIPGTVFKKKRNIKPYYFDSLSKKCFY